MKRKIHLNARSPISQLIYVLFLTESCLHYPGVLVTRESWLQLTPNPRQFLFLVQTVLDKKQSKAKQNKTPPTNISKAPAESDFL